MINFWRIITNIILSISGVGALVLGIIGFLYDLFGPVKFEKIILALGFPNLNIFTLLNISLLLIFILAYIIKKRFFM